MRRRLLWSLLSVATCASPTSTARASVSPIPETSAIGALEAVESPQPLRQYRGRSVLVGGAVVAWVAGLSAILFLRRRTTPPLKADDAKPEEPTARLAALARRGMAGVLTVDESIELERLLLDRWSESIDTHDPLARRTAIARSSARTAYDELERWLYRRSGAADSVIRLLEPISRLDAVHPDTAEREATP